MSWRFPVLSMHRETLRLISGEPQGQPTDRALWPGPGALRLPQSLGSAAHETRKRPGGAWPPGRRKRYGIHRAFGWHASDRFSPIERIGPPPGQLRPVEPIAGPDKVIGRDDIVRGVGDNAMPAIPVCTPCCRSQQSELQRSAPVSPDHPDAAQVARIWHMSRLYQSCKGDGHTAAKCKPPIALVK